MASLKILFYHEQEAPSRLSWTTSFRFHKVKVDVRTKQEDNVEVEERTK